MRRLLGLILASTLILGACGSSGDKKESNDEKTSVDENKSLNDDFKKYSKVRKRYERFKYKKTYANVLNITTISKDRISKINRYDPAGEISYSKETVDKIENSIKIRFLS
ncbi:TPA: hypothetical protein O9P88_002528 [Staphylococcus aureus]|nr:hypothetical protein [Staphylococcus aureus]